MDHLNSQQVKDIKRFLLVAKRARTCDALNWTNRFQATKEPQVLDNVKLASEDIEKINVLVALLCRRQ